MDFDEFEESEVMFSDYSSDQSVESENNEGSCKHCNQSDGYWNNDVMIMKMKRREGVIEKVPRIIGSSYPVNIPEMNSFKYDDHDDVASYQPFDECNNDGQMMRMPPHLIVERRDSEEIARSFSPLRGKNLCDVRNSILRMTGFFER